MDDKPICIVRTLVRASSAAAGEGQRAWQKCYPTGDARGRWWGWLLLARHEINVCRHTEWAIILPL